MPHPTGAPRKILILDENCSVPFDRRVWRESTALAEAGYQVTVISPMGSKFDREGHAVVDGIHIYRFPTLEAGESLLGYAIEYGWALVAMGWLTLVAFLRRGFEVIQLCNPPDLLYLIGIPYRWMGRRVIFDHHDLSPETYLSKTGRTQPNRVWRLLHYFERQTFRHSDVIMSTNESYAKVARERGGMDSEDVFVVRNGPDLARFTPVAPDHELRKGKQHLAFYVGTMGAQDGVDYLLRATLELTRTRQDFHVIIVGGGTELESLEAYAKELELEAYVTFTGRVSDAEMMTALSTADVCVSPDPFNPLNDVSTMNKTLEYMAMGKPVVAFDLIETKVSAGDAGLYASDNSERELAELISRLFDSPELRAQMGEIGRRRIREGLSWEHSKAHLRAAYDRAFEQAR